MIQVLASRHEIPYCLKSLVRGVVPRILGRSTTALRGHAAEVALRTFRGSPIESRLSSVTLPALAPAA